MCVFDPTDWQDITLFQIDANNNLSWNYPDATYDQSYVYYQLPDEKIWNLLYLGSNTSCPFPGTIPSGQPLKTKGKVVRKKRLPYPDNGNDGFYYKFKDLIFNLNPSGFSLPTPRASYTQPNFADMTGFNFNPAGNQLSWSTVNPGNVDLCHLFILPPGAIVWQHLFTGQFALGTLPAVIGPDVLLKGKAFNSQYYTPAYVDPNLHRSMIFTMNKP